MATNKKRLIAAAKRNVRTPRPARAREVEKKGYRVVAVSLYTPEAEWVDQATEALKRAGSPKANRSLVVREAILRLQRDLQDKNPEEVVRDFTEHQAKRAQ